MDFNQKTDEELVCLYREGQAAAFSALIDRHLTPLYRFALRYCASAPDAEDVVQEAAVKAWKCLASFDATKRFLPWLFSIVKNTAIDTVRKKKILSTTECFAPEEQETNFADTIPDEQLLPLAMLQQAETKAELGAAIDRLSREQRTILLMHFYDDLSLAEIAELLTIPLNTVKSHRFRALTALRKILEQSATAPISGAAAYI